MSEMPFLGLNSQMFSGAFRCPNQACGFASSAENIYDCPNCGAHWRQPVVLDAPSPVAGPQTGAAVVMSCFLCGEDFNSDQPAVFAGGNDLAHKACLAPEPVVDAEALETVSEGYLSTIQDKRPPGASQPRRRKRKRRRSSAGRTQQSTAGNSPAGAKQTPSSQSSDSAPSTSDTRSTPS